MALRAKRVTQAVHSLAASHVHHDRAGSPKTHCELCAENERKHQMASKRAMTEIMALRAGTKKVLDMLEVLIPATQFEELKESLQLEVHFASATEEGEGANPRRSSHMSETNAPISTGLDERTQRKLSMLESELGRLEVENASLLERLQAAEARAGMQGNTVTGRRSTMPGMQPGMLGSDTLDAHNANAMHSPVSARFQSSQPSPLSGGSQASPISGGTAKGVKFASDLHDAAGAAVGVGGAMRNSQYSAGGIVDDPESQEGQEVSKGPPRRTLGMSMRRSDSQSSFSLNDLVAGKIAEGGAGEVGTNSRSPSKGAGVRSKIGSTLQQSLLSENLADASSESLADGRANPFSIANNQQGKSSWSALLGKVRDKRRTDLTSELATKAAEVEACKAECSQLRRQAERLEKDLAHCKHDNQVLENKVKMLDARSKRLEKKVKEGGKSGKQGARKLVNNVDGADDDGSDTDGGNISNCDEEGEQSSAASRSPAKIGGGPGCLNLPHLQQQKITQSHTTPQKYVKRIQSTPHLKTAGVAVGTHNDGESTENGLEPFLLKAGHKGAKVRRALIFETRYGETQQRWGDIG
eukprot:gnl/MRDRNA2_/MRDRNA2_91291_c0_seq1.p1 gnl/MRDRNA2_/MRDRNA2_91291_c0~~gnl/MRDRNA2_/MRDRNA2_91291_c0_seq1.p1  ORF type:complete len:583 (-),score=115.00 gnl/MRDRNA2_/MRDRNA2_91291_c0_seq1:183-1931(-)